MYKKPLIINADQFEGVYALSGSDNNNDNGTVLAVITRTEEWQDNKNYFLNITNLSDSHVDSVTVTFVLSGTISSVDGGIASYSIEGNNVLITFNNYGNGFDGHDTKSAYFHVAGSGEFSLTPMN